MERTIHTQLKHWQHQEDRLPLMIRGARQVGKTHVVDAFGRANFELVLTINFEQQPEYRACFQTFKKHCRLKIESYQFLYI